MKTHSLHRFVKIVRKLYSKQSDTTGYQENTLSTVTTNHMNGPVQSPQVSAEASSMAPKGGKSLVTRCIHWGVSILITRAGLNKLFTNHLPFSPTMYNWSTMSLMATKRRSIVHCSQWCAQSDAGEGARLPSVGRCTVWRVVSMHGTFKEGLRFRCVVRRWSVHSMNQVESQVA